MASDEITMQDVRLMAGEGPLDAATRGGEIIAGNAKNADGATRAENAQVQQFAPCPTCGQYSHTIGEDARAKAYRHFQSMVAHPVRGHPMGHAFDEATRDAANVLMAFPTPVAQASAMREALEALNGMIRLSEMGFEQSMREPEENGNYVAYNRAVAIRDKLAALAAAPALAPAADDGGLREAGQFLVYRLEDHSNRITSEEDANEWHGHVAPALARFRAALAKHRGSGE